MDKFLKFDELKFDEKEHKYIIDGNELPSVTTLMKPLSNSYYKGIDNEVMQKAADRGTAIHNAIENYIKFGIDDAPEQYAGYFEAYKRWKKDYKPEIMGTECRVYHKFLRYAGTIDMPCVIFNEKICIDFKTSATINKALTGVQLEAYAKAYESHGYRFDAKAIVHLRKDGSYKLVKHQKNDSESWEVFGALILIHNHLKKY